MFRGTQGCGKSKQLGTVLPRKQSFPPAQGVTISAVKRALCRHGILPSKGTICCRWLDTWGAPCYRLGQGFHAELGEVYMPLPA